MKPTTSRNTKWWRRFLISSKDVRLDMLRARTDIKTGKKNPMYYIRRAKKMRPTGNCEVCGSPANCRHHISPLICGGTNQPANLINICYKCHCEVHTWMMPQIPEDIKEMDNAFRSIIG